MYPMLSPDTLPASCDLSNSGGGQHRTITTTRQIDAKYGKKRTKEKKDALISNYAT